jgi:DNA-binding SARP family transcriptional activator
VTAGAVTGTEESSPGRLPVHLLGPFSITLGEWTAGAWARPSAKCLCGLVMLSAARSVGREVAYDVLFANLGSTAASNALSRALSLAKSALDQEASGLLRADRTHIWLVKEIPIDIDLEHHEEALRSALSMEPGSSRDEALSRVLTEERVLLEDEPYADWVFRARGSRLPAPKGARSWPGTGPGARRGLGQTRSWKPGKVASAMGVPYCPTER